MVWWIEELLFLVIYHLECVRPKQTQGAGGFKTQRRPRRDIHHFSFCEHETDLTATQDGALA